MIFDHHKHAVPLGTGLVIAGLIAWDMARGTMLFLFTATEVVFPVEKLVPGDRQSAGIFHYKLLPGVGLIHSYCTLRLNLRDLFPRTVRQDMKHCQMVRGPVFKDQFYVYPKVINVIKAKFLHV